MLRAVWYVLPVVVLRIKLSEFLAWLLHTIQFLQSTWVTVLSLLWNNIFAIDGPVVLITLTQILDEERTRFIRLANRSISAAYGVPAKATNRTS